VIRIHTDPDVAWLNYHDDTVLAFLRGMPVVSWQPGRRVFVTEVTWTTLLARRLSRAGYAISIDGRLWVPPDRSCLSPALQDLFADLDALAAKQ
jgi:hypothetical protein